MNELPRPLLLVGGGRMGSALARGWLARGLLPSDLYVVEPDEGRRLAFVGAHAVAQPAELPPELAPQVALFAVKPQVLEAVLPTYREIARRTGVLLSIVAGKPIAAFEAVFGSDRPIVRSMPNTPAQVGRGMTVLFANPACGENERRMAEALMAAVGEVAWVSDEDWLHAVTAVSGSGPAYVFHLVEALAQAGERLGLPAELAMRLARATVAGAGELLYRSGESASALREAVTSPGGTTEAALGVLMGEQSLAALVSEAVAAAERRSRQLAAAGN